MIQKIYSTEMVSNTFVKTNRQLNKFVEELWIILEDIDIMILKILKKWFMSFEKYKSLKKVKTDEEILFQLEEELKLLWLNLYDL